MTNRPSSKSSRQDGGNKADSGTGSAYWITPVRGDDLHPVEQVVKNWVVEKGIYAIGARTPGRREMTSGDWLCFYAVRKGIVGHAQIAKPAEFNPAETSAFYPYILRLGLRTTYTHDPVILDDKKRSELDAFAGPRGYKNLGFFVQATHRITEHDFRHLTRESKDRPRHHP